MFIQGCACSSKARDDQWIATCQSVYHSSLRKECGYSSIKTYTRTKVDYIQESRHRLPLTIAGSRYSPNQQSKDRHSCSSLSVLSLWIVLAKTLKDASRDFPVALAGCTGLSDDRWLFECTRNSQSWDLHVGLPLHCATFCELFVAPQFRSQVELVSPVRFSWRLRKRTDSNKAGPCIHVDIARHSPAHHVTLPAPRTRQVRRGRRRQRPPAALDL
jgi:hypothetical protein